MPWIVVIIIIIIINSSVLLINMIITASIWDFLVFSRPYKCGFRFINGNNDILSLTNTKYEINNNEKYITIKI